MVVLLIVTSVRGRAGSGSRGRNFALGQRLFHRVTGVVIGICFILRAVVSNALDHYFWVVAPGEGALRVGPIVLGLAFVVVGKRAPSFLGLAKVSRCFGRIFGDHEIAEGVDRIAFVARLDDEF